MQKEEIIRTLNQAYFSEQRHEKRLIELLPSVLSQFQVFVDLGASLGQYTYFANQMIKGGRLFAIEPDCIRFEELEKNCCQWAIESENHITPIRAAVAEKEGEISFYSTRSNVSGGLFRHATQDENVEWHEEKVPCTTLDQILADDREAFIKMDVEGVELRVLRGATETLKQGKSIFLIEIHPWIDPEGQKNTQEIFSLMKSFGYRGIKLFGHWFFVPFGKTWLKLQAVKWQRRIQDSLRYRLPWLFNRGN